MHPTQKSSETARKLTSNLFSKREKTLGKPALRRALVLLVAVILVWRITATGLSAYYVESSTEDDVKSASKALFWNSRQPEALLRQAIAVRERDPSKAEDLLAGANSADPTDPRPFLTMASLVLAQGDKARSESLAATAETLAPSDPWIQARTAAYWVTREDLDQALHHWSLTMDTNSAFRKNLFPVLLKIAEDPRARPAFKPIAESPPSWWEEFFGMVASRATDMDTVRALYTFRGKSFQTPITESERKAYVTRLEKEGIATEAFIHWVNGLNGKQKYWLGLIYDGGFELEPSNWGFDWRIRSTKTAIVNRASTYGVDREAALHLLFDNHSKRFAGVAQTLFMGPGSYRFTGRVRTEQLQSEGGLKWIVRCLLPKREVLGESNRFLGSNDWSVFAFEVEVPDSCVLQEIQLVSAGKNAYEQKITGEAWFDRLSVQQIKKLTRVTNATLSDMVINNNPANETLEQREDSPHSGPLSNAGKAAEPMSGNVSGSKPPR